MLFTRQSGDGTMPSDSRTHIFGSFHRVELVIHGCDELIRSKDSYGNESRKKDTEH